MPEPREIAYFVHDLGDAAVVRRVQMLHVGGAKVIVVGFRRRAGPVGSIDGATTIDLGLTGDGQLLHRIWAVFRTLLRFGAVQSAVASADAIMARNLEMLVLGIRARRGRRLVYECLDIHRLLLGPGLASRTIAAIEGWALARVDQIITSSNRFADDYFRIRRRFPGPIALVENKVLALGADESTASLARHGRASGPPWIIGWFGMLRCRRSFNELSHLAANSGGAIKVVIAGIPSANEFVDFAADVTKAPGLEFVGPYKAADLPQLYGRVHFAWAIDYFEEGLNSAWLLPNRLYESMAHGAVPIALATVETGKWLKRNGAGIVVDKAPSALPALLAGMDEGFYRRHCAQVAGLPDKLLFTTNNDCIELVDAILSDDGPNPRQD